MSNKLAMKLAESKVGRILLHLTAIKQNGHFLNHFRGIKREVVSIFA